MGTTQVSPDSPEIPDRGNLLSAEEREACSHILVMLRDGPVVLRSRLLRVQDQGLDARRLYLLAVEARQSVMEKEGLSPLKLRTWDEVNPEGQTT